MAIFMILNLPIYEYGWLVGQSLCIDLAFFSINKVLQFSVFFITVLHIVTFLKSGFLIVGGG